MIAQRAFWTSRMKALVCTVMWWPGIDHGTEIIINKCSECQLVCPTQPSAPWAWSALPWSNFHLDFVGPFLKHTFLVIIDAHTKRLETIPLLEVTSRLTIQQLQLIFTHFNLSDTVVTGNRTCFASTDLNGFYQKMASTTGKQHCTIPPAMAK